MQPKISKTLEGIIARAAFNTTKAEITRSLKDRLTLELLREERRRQIEQRLMRLVDDARSADIGDDELREMMDLIMEGDAS